MKAAVLHAFGQAPRWQEFGQPVPHDGEELIEVTAAPLNNVDRVPLSTVSELWARDQRGRRPVFIP